VCGLNLLQLYSLDWGERLSKEVSAGYTLLLQVLVLGLALAPLRGRGTLKREMLL